MDDPNDSIEFRIGMVRGQRIILDELKKLRGPVPDPKRKKIGCPVRELAAPDKTGPWQKPSKR